MAPPVAKVDAVTTIGGDTYGAAFVVNPPKVASSRCAKHTSVGSLVGRAVPMPADACRCLGKTVPRFLQPGEPELRPSKAVEVHLTSNPV